MPERIHLQDDERSYGDALCGDANVHTINDRCDCDGGCECGHEPTSRWISCMACVMAYCGEQIGLQADT